MRNKRGGRGYTLIELLMVIAIIMVLTGIALAAVSIIRERARIAETRRMVLDLETAIKRFQMDYHQYPWSPSAPAGSLVAADIIRELAPTRTRLASGRNPSDPKFINKRLKDYLIIPDKFLADAGSGATLVDPWGSEYLFAFDVQAQEPKVCSKGPNGIDETSDGDDDFGDDLTNL